MVICKAVELTLPVIGRSYSPVRCVCASMNPGDSVASPKSITSASGGIAAFGPTAAILLPADDHQARAIMRWPSNMRAAFRTVVPVRRHAGLVALSQINNTQAKVACATRGYFRLRRPRPRCTC